MAELSDGESTIVRAGLAFVHSRIVQSLGATLSDAGSFIASWFDFSPGTTKTRLENLKTDIKGATPSAKLIASDLVPQLQGAAAAIGAIATNLADPSFNGVVQALDQFAKLLDKLDLAIKAVAKAAATGRPGEPFDNQVKADIEAVDAPIVKPVKAVADNASKLLAAGFDEFCKTLFGIDNATAQLVQQFKWDKATGELTAQLLNLHGELGGVVFNDTVITAYLHIPTKVHAGIKLEGKIASGLRGDPMMDAIIPGDPTTKDQVKIAIALDTDTGLTFGDGGDQRLILPLSIGLPGVEFREFAISRPAADNKDGAARFDLTAVVAGKIGSLLAVVAEDGGVSLKHAKGQPSQVVPKRPSGVGFRMAGGPISGGGFLRYREPEADYGALAKLAFGSIDLTAMAVFKTTPEFSFVTVIGAHFLPKVELGFGFTLNGVGGILAYNRTLSIEKLTTALKDGVVSNILFPKDPVAAAPTILNQLATIFPVDKGTFVIGPMVDLGWGSQAGILSAKIGVLISSADPQVVILGSAQIQVPPDPPGGTLPKVVDLGLDVMAVIGADELYLRAALVKSKLAGMSISGDFGMLARWAGRREFALSAGGFFPNYQAPDKLKDLRRLSIPIKPPVPKVKLEATGYFALTANSVQVGGDITLDAQIGPVHGEGHFGLDALFEWSPSLHFVFDVRAGVKLSISGHTVAGVDFKGHLEGTTPWRLSGNASIEVLFWSIDFDLGPYTWGEVAPNAATVSALDAAVAALKADSAWSTRAGKPGKYRLRAQPSPILLIEPQTVLQVTQSAVPFDTQIDRVGPSPSTQHRLAFGTPMVGGQTVAGGTHLTAPFATGQFQNLTTDQQLTRPAFEDLPAGVALAPVKGGRSGATADRTLMWETSFPGTGTGPTKGMVQWGMIASSLVGSAPVAKAKLQANPYRKGPKPKPIGVIGGELRQVARIDTPTVLGIAMPASDAARVVAEGGGAAAGLQMVNAGVFG